ncbi:unnamed protein product [Arctia plantaginis]|uniref:Uncharacterized protein n=1 Tax=Arctia plantaginis TaxID=874455 RepID=A0A8S0ZKF3_ARCPL|nr:unnamed protein product [Arctia plantaginis]
MSAVLLFVVCLAGMATATEFDDNSIVTMDIKQRQMIILKLLNHPMEPLMYKDLVEIGQNFKIEDNTESFTKPDVVKTFVKMMKVGVLPRGEIFTLHIDRQLKEVVTIFHMLYYAKDFTTFFKTACWMRLHLNEGMFAYALTVAVRHREDCRGIILPSPYEIYPYYFVRADVIQKAYLLKMKRGLLDLKLCDFYGIRKTDKDVYIIDENIYDKRVYFTDDDRYWPWLKMHNGQEFPVRFNNYVIARDTNLDIIRLCEEYERIIRDCIIRGFIEYNGMRLSLTKYEDMETLGKLIYGKTEKTGMDKTYIESYRYLLIVMKAALGLNTFTSDKYFVTPSILDHYQTALRDPVFYMLQKRIIDLVHLFKLRLPSYTKEDLYFPGVKIENVVVDKLITYFDDFLMDMTNAVTLTEEELKKARSDMIFMVRKRRLNHQPFKVTIDIASDKAVDCVVRIFLGPKKDHLNRLIDINNNRLNFVEVDSFLYKLNTGKNTIVRDSHDMHNLVKDRMMTRDLWKKIESMNDMKDLLRKDLRNYHTGFPTRLLLPKGHVGGLDMMFYICVTPLRLVDNVDMSILDTNRKDFMVDFRSSVLLDKMPLGFPLDRHIDIGNFFTPNMRFIDVRIYHKKMTCDMKTRWYRWVLKNYNMIDRTPVIADTYFVDTDLNMKVDRNLNLFDV